MVTTSTLLLLLVAQQPDPRTGRHVAPLRDFVSIRLSADRSVYYQGERVRLSIALMNTADRAVQGYFALTPGLGPTRLLYRRTGTDFSEMRCFLAPPGTFGLRLRTLNAGEELVKDVDVSLVTLEPMTLLLDRVGLYEFLVAFEDVPADANARLESNAVTIQVVEPPASELEAMAAYTEPLAYLAQVPDGPAAFVPPERMAEAAAFIGRFPRSRYAGPVKEGLLKWLKYRIQTRRATEEQTALYESLIHAVDAVPPELHAEASPSTLWPPNRKMVDVLVSLSVSDADDPNPKLKLESVACDDQCMPALDVSGADLGTDDREFAVRAERKGAGAGRTYTITYSATDASGNRALTSTRVFVPHDQGRK